MKPGGPALITLAQQAIDLALWPGARAIDATMGNGHDTLCLARGVAPSGRVIAFDIQPAALISTRQRLAGAGLESLVDLQLCGHEQMLARVPSDWPGSVAAVMFNLGYLPGGNKGLVTRADTTCAALGQALRLLHPAGLLSLLLYRGHAGAGEETEAVMAWLAALPGAYAVTRHDSPGPVLYLVGPVQRPADPLSRPAAM